MPASIAPLANQFAGLAGGERVDQRLGIVLVAAHAVDVAQKISFSAPSAWATAVAAVSALTFSFSPVSLRHIDGITGTMPA